MSIFSIKDFVRKENCIEIKSEKYLSSRKFDTRYITKEKINKIVNAEGFQLCN